MDFWASKRETFGEIASFALNLPTVPASTSGVERVFSLASIVQGGRRYRLGAGSTGKELMIKVNRNFFLQRKRKVNGILIRIVSFDIA